MAAYARLAGLWMSWDSPGGISYLPVVRALRFQVRTTIFSSHLGSEHSPLGSLEHHVLYYLSHLDPLWNFYQLSPLFSGACIFTFPVYIRQDYFPFVVIKFCFILFLSSTFFFTLHNTQSNLYCVSYQDTVDIFIPPSTCGIHGMVHYIFPPLSSELQT